MNPIIPTLRRLLLTGQPIENVRLALKIMDADPADKADAEDWLNELDELPLGVRMAFLSLALERTIERM